MIREIAECFSGCCSGFVGIVLMIAALCILAVLCSFGGDL